jgi:poly(3-hydroxybutyrate) depolymerase
MLILALISLPLIIAREFSVSGFSSGAFMATQMHIAFSGDVISAGLVAGGPYYCSSNSYQGWRNCLNNTSAISFNTIPEYISTYEQSGNIDPVSYLSNSTVFILHGTKDSIVLPETGHLTHELYKYYMQSSNIVTVFDLVAEHNWPTLDFGGDCLEIGIKDCDYDTAEKILTLAYGSLNPRTDMIRENLKRFDQSPYVSSLHDAGMAKTGFIYIPSKCQDNLNECKIHVALHGCLINYEYAGDYFIANTGLNQWAEANEIVVIYPQTAKKGPSEIDEIGCWDVWGYTGEKYATKQGLQMRAVHEMTQNPPRGICGLYETGLNQASLICE